MKFTILKSGNKTFIVKDFDIPAFGICIGNGADIIQVFQWANKEFKKLKELDAFRGGVKYE